MTANSRFPFTPYPDGWFVVALSDELRPGRVLTRRCLGQDLVIYRTASGTPVVADAYCPHLGAHFGHGGHVVGENLRCPFHSFDFGPDGRCVRTPYEGKVPPLSRLRTLPVRERNGVLLIYHDGLDRDPAWEAPVLEDESWLPIGTDRLRIRSHPQETTENSVDAGHLAELHGYEACDVIQPMEIDGPRLKIAYRMTRHAHVLGIPLTSVSTEFEVEVHGLGYSLVHVDIASLGVRVRLRVLPTPIDEERLDLRLIMEAHREPAFRGLAAPLRLLPTVLALRLLAPAVFLPVKNDVRQDRTIWENKIYTEPPALAEGDGPVGAYRRWCRQFYGESRVGAGPRDVRLAGGSRRT